MKEKDSIVVRRLLKPEVLRIVVVIAQMILGVLFVCSGLMKGIDPMGTAIKIGEYAAKFGLPMAMPLATGLSVSLNVFEALLGVCLLTGGRPRITALLTLTLMVPMILLTLYIYIFNPVSDCGCFGDALKISNAATFWKNVVLLLLTILLYRHSEYMWRALGAKADIPTTLGAGLLLLYFNIYPLINLPVVDFRPYKVGADLHELTTSGATEGEYEYSFVYAKDGKEKAFTMEELETIDDSWTFVRDETKEVTPPNSAPGADFVVIDSDGMPQTELLARPEKDALMYIVNDLSTASMADMEVGAKLLELTGMPVTLVAGNSFDEIHSKENAMKSAPFSNFYFLDRTTAKTVIRSNPGLLVLHGGKIARKASVAQLRGLLKKDDFVKNPYAMMSKGELTKGRWYTFGVLGIGLLVLIVLAIKRRIH